MPISILTASEAVANRKNNPFAKWGDRLTPNRIEPIAKPSFDAPFRLKRGTGIFTVGSCFARNIESELQKYGFSVPMLELFMKPEFKGLSVGSINNYSVPSIYNELAWALDPEIPFRPEQNFFETLPGRFVDAHISSSEVKPGPWGELSARRDAIRQAYSTIRDCSAAIITLGLSEVWFDTASGHYLNATPLPSMIRGEPDRFELHVLSHDDIQGHLRRAIHLMLREAPGLDGIILTVSPVPLGVTHRAMDVIVANTYSKSVLRSVVEEIAAEFPKVVYFPSYESVLMSDRQRTWQDDFIHVTRDIVAINVSRMLEGYLEADSRTDDRDAIAIGGIAAAVERAAAARNEPLDRGSAFFREFGHLSAVSTDFAIEHAHFLFENKDVAGAVLILEGVRASLPTSGIVFLARCYRAAGRANEAVDLLRPEVAQTRKSKRSRRALVAALVDAGRPDEARAEVSRWLAAVPKLKGHILRSAAHAFSSTMPHDAVAYLRSAEALEHEDPLFNLEYAESLAKAGDMAAATARLREFVPSSAGEQKRMQEVLAAAGIGREVARDRTPRSAASS